MRTPPSMRALERRFAQERAEIAVNRFAECLFSRWDEFMEADMDAIEIIQKLRIDPNSMDTWPRTIVYLRRCIADGKRPDYRELMAKLAPWVRLPI